MLRTYHIVKPGLEIAKLFDAVATTVQCEAIPHFARNQVGHGSGVDGYDPSSIARSASGALAENMVICAEPPYYMLGIAGLEVEDATGATSHGVESAKTIDTGLRIINLALDRSPRGEMRHEVSGVSGDRQRGADLSNAI